MDEGNDIDAIYPPKIGAEKKLKRAKSDRSSPHFWRKKISQEQEQQKVYEYAEDTEDELEKRKKEDQQKMKALDTDRNSRGKSPPAMFTQGQVGTSTLAAPTGEGKKKKMSFRKLVKRMKKFGSTKKR